MQDADLVQNSGSNNSGSGAPQY